MAFDSSLKEALKICKIWNEQKNPPKVYTNDGTRIHHYQVGLVGLGVSLVLKKIGGKTERKIAEDIAGFSTGLLVDDFNDLLDATIRFLSKHFPNRYYS